ncbi:Endopolyphosphatase, partial [Mortierella sp. AM989]
MAYCFAMAAVTGAASEPTSGLAGRFLHITDIHPDELYLEGAAVSTSCHTILTSMDDANEATDNNIQRGRFNLPLWHKAETTYKALTIQDMSIIRPGPMSNNIDEAGMAGYYGMPNTICDSPLTFAEAALDWIGKNLVGSIDFIVWTGDNARHDLDNTHPRTQDQINRMNKEMAMRFLKTFPPGPNGKRIPIVPTIGNNDVYPHNIMFPGPGPILQHYSEIWSEFIPEDQLETFRHGGYYVSEVIPGKVSVFGLNSLYFYFHNVVVDGCKKKYEPGTEEMDWLEKELKLLRKRKMVAYLTGHIPPEKNSFTKSCYARYTQIALDYRDVIVGHLYGHANIDHFFFLSENKRGKARIPEDEEEEEEGDQALSLIDNPFRLSDLDAYLEALWKQYDDIPKDAKHGNYAVVQVSPSIVPAYYPAMRVFNYELANNIVSNPNDSLDNVSNSLDAEEDLEELYQNFERLEGQKLNECSTALISDAISLVAELWAKYKEGHKKPPTLPPVPVNTFGYPLSFTQYWTNLTLANEKLTPPEFVVEYHTQDDYGMQHLGASEYLTLARRISKNKPLKKKYLKRMMVQSGAEKT